MREGVKKERRDGETEGGSEGWREGLRKGGRQGEMKGGRDGSLCRTDLSTLYVFTNIWDPYTYIYIYRISSNRGPSLYFLLGSFQPSL